MGYHNPRLLKRPAIKPATRKAMCYEKKLTLVRLGTLDLYFLLGKDQTTGERIDLSRDILSYSLLSDIQD